MRTEETFAIRTAQASDVEAILSILTEVACRIWVDLSTPDRVEKIKEQIIDCLDDDCSFVAVDGSGVVVGFQLARRKLIRNLRGTDEVYIYLVYAGVTAAAEGRKVFKRLIEAEKRHNLPLIAEVKPDNKSNMAARLLHYNFRHFSDLSIIGNFRWDPG